MPMMLVIPRSRWSMLKDENSTNFPVPGSEGTWICPMTDGCCFNPGEDKDGNTVGMCECIGMVCESPVAFL